MRYFWYRLSHKNRIRLLWLTFFLLLAAFNFFKLPHQPPAEIVSRNVKVLDGDTVKIKGEKVRLRHIDAPESGQTCKSFKGKVWPCGRRATQKLVQLVINKKVKCLTYGLDTYNRVLASCYWQDGKTSIAGRMVRIGYAVAKGDRYRHSETLARKEKRGIWSGSFDEPYIWRRHQLDDFPDNNLLTRFWHWLQQWFM